MNYVLQNNESIFLLEGDNLMKILKFIGIIIFSILCVGVMFISEHKSWVTIGSITGIFLGLAIPEIKSLAEDLTDNTNWKTSQRKLLRGDIVKKDSIVRISFAYLFRIKVGNKYLLVKNERNTGKYQPVGGVYKFTENEKMELKNKFHVIDDDRIPIDKSSKDDYRLQLENRYLKKFIKRFDKKANRESIDNLSREFIEELIDKEIVNWNQINYRVCGRHITNLEFSQHFQIYEILLADIVELLPTKDQEIDLKKLAENSSDLYKFADAYEINSLGVDPKNKKLQESIATHTKKILQENEGNLCKLPEQGKCYRVNIIDSNV